MSRIFGEIRQIAFVVPDIDEAMRYWSATLGVGPFFVRRSVVFEDYRYYGDAVPSPAISIALGNSGGLQIELIEQHDDNPSIYRDFLNSGRDGLQHIAAWVTCAEFDRQRAELISRGTVVVQEGLVSVGRARVAYFATSRGEPGTTFFELADVRDEKHYGRALRVADAARGWDGVDPVREVPR